MVSRPDPLPPSHLPASGDRPAPGDADVARFRAAEAAARRLHRAAGELRRGAPVVIEAAPHRLVALAAETAGAAGLADLRAAADAPPVLLLAASRAAAILRRPTGAAAADPPWVALRLAEVLMTPARLRTLADPTAEQLLPDPPLPLAAGDVPDGLAALGGSAIALAKAAELLPAMVVAEARPDAGGPLLSVGAEDVAGRAASAAILLPVAEARVPLEDAPDARVVAFRAPDTGIEHLAIVIGRPETRDAPLVRLHSECFTGDLLGSLRCDCGPQLRDAIRRMAGEGAGAVLYLAQEGRGIGLVNKLRAYAMQDRGLDTVDANRALGWGADERGFAIAASMLRGLGITRIRLLTDNPAKLSALASCGIEVIARERVGIAANGINDRYLATKVTRLGHLR